MMLLLTQRSRNALISEPDRRQCNSALTVENDVDLCHIGVADFPVEGGQFLDYLGVCSEMPGSEQGSEQIQIAAHAAHRAPVALLELHSGTECSNKTSSVLSICRKPLFFNRSSQPKAFVACGRDLIAFLLVCGDAADIRHEYTRFPRDVGADVPRVRH